MYAASVPAFVARLNMRMRRDLAADSIGYGEATVTRRYGWAPPSCHDEHFGRECGLACLARFRALAALPLERDAEADRCSLGSRAFRDWGRRRYKARPLTRAGLAKLRGPAERRDRSARRQSVALGVRMVFNARRN